MNAMARRGIVCWLGLSLCGAALYAQETPREDPKQKDPQNLGAQGEEYVRKLTAELKARAMEFEKVQAQLQQAEATKQSLAAELEKLRRAVEGMATEKNVVEERARKQVDELAAQVREIMARKNGPDNANRSYQNAYAEATKRAFETLAARRAEGAAALLDEAKPDPTRSEVEEGWKRLLERADVMLEKSRLNDEMAAKYLPKLESAVTQLRKAGRNQEANELLAVAGTALGRGMPSPNVPRDEAPPENVRRDVRDPRAPGDVNQAIDELRRDVEQLRGEVRELHHLLQRGKTNESNRRERSEAPERSSERRERSDVRSGAKDLVGVHSRYPGEVLRVGESSRSVRVGDRVKKGEALAVIRSTNEIGETAGEFTLDAPADGKIVERNLSVGEVIKPGDLLFRIEPNGSDQRTELR